VTEPGVNLVPARYRSISVASVPVPLDEASLRAYFVGRPAYRRTRYIVVRAAAPDRPALDRHDGTCATAVVEVTKRSDAPLFSEISTLTLIADAGATAFVDDPEVDTGVPSSLARAAASRAPQARCVVVRGRYGHVGFIADPAPIRIAVVEVVPPHPAKLLDQASRVLDLAEDLPPIELVPELTDLGVLAASHPAGHYLFPCRAGTATAGQAVSYLDEIPPRADWTLVGCARSRAIHDWFYQDAAPVVDMCPRNLAARARARTGDPAVVLTKCCLLEDEISVADGLVVVPWGASLAQVKQGLARAAEAAACPAGLALR
jgi:hypothetical protein